MKKVLESYDVGIDNVPATVEIIDDSAENVPIYQISMPELDKGTEALLNNLVDELAEIIPLQIEEVTDPKKLDLVRKGIYDRIESHLVDKFPEIDVSENKLIIGILLHRMYGLGKYEILLSDDYLEEIVINSSSTEIAVYHKKHGWLKTNLKVESEDKIFDISSQIGRKVNRSISSLNPIMDAHLLSGDRVASTLFPISTQGNTITIRKFARSPWNVVNLIMSGTISMEIVAFLWLAIQYELNLLVAGGTASGKTSVLNALATLIPPSQRIISIEDTREIALPNSLKWNWVPLTTRGANADDQGEISMLDLMVASLRMRPDRIVVGEVRRKEEAETMFEAMHTGHSVYTTMHADTVQQVIRRLLEPPIKVPKTEAEALHLVLVQFRDRRKNLRRTLEVAEIIPGGKADLNANYLFRWHPRTDKFEKVDESNRVFEDLNLHTGMTPSEIRKDIKEKEKILGWLIKHKYDDAEKLGMLFKLYYKDPSYIVKCATSNKNPKLLMGSN